MKEIIRTEELTKVFGKHYAVDHVNLSIKKGEIYSFLGLNGAGKTTTIRMLLGMISPTKGSSFLDGKKVSAGNTAIWNEVGYMVEAPHSYPELTVEENLEIVRKLRGMKDRSAVSRIIKMLKLETYTHKKAKHLSLGNAQRLGIAKAMIHQPKILILDEPTNGLDPAGIIEIRKLLQDLARNEAVTILISSHQLDEISKVATNIGIINNGKLVKEINSSQLENQLQKTLLVDGKRKTEMISILTQAGYQVTSFSEEDGDVLEIRNMDAIQHPDKIATLLVEARHPPTLLKIEKEDLETYFLRIINNGGGVK